MVAALAAWTASAAVVEPMAQTAPPSASSAEPLRLRLGLVEGLSGPFANAGEAVERNLIFAIERINARGVRVGGRPLTLELVSLDSKGEVDGALQALQVATDRDIRVILKGTAPASLPASSAPSTGTTRARPVARCCS